MIGASAPSPDHLRTSPGGVDAWIMHLRAPAFGIAENGEYTPPPVSRMPSSISLSSETSDRNYTHLRPLPSPCPDGKKNRGKQSSDEDELSNAHSSPASPESPSGTSGGDKTNAFFSSPFAIAIPRPNDIPIQPTRTGSLALPRRKPPRAVVELDHSSSIFNDHPSSLQDTKTRVVSDSTTTPKAAPSRTQSTNSNFFFAPSIASSSAKPTPPPPLPVNLTSSPEKSATSHFSAISRFFPSRHSQKTAVPPNNHGSVPVPQPSFEVKGKSAIEGLQRSPPHVRERARERHIQDLSESPVHSHGGSHGGSDAGEEVLRLEVPSPQKPQPPSASPTPHHPQPIPIRRETQAKATPLPLPQSGDVLGLPDTPLQLIEQLGRGAFSSVWLAKDQSGELGLSRKKSITRVGSLKRRGRRAASRDAEARDGLLKQGSAGPKVVRSRRASQSMAKMDRDVKLGGLSPMAVIEDISSESNTSRFADTRPPQKEYDIALRVETVGDDHDKQLSRSISNGSLRMGEYGRLVAVKMLDRSLCDTNDRTRISFVREVEVLRHISHPSIVSYLHSLTTPTHHCLVLEHVAGGELFDMINTDEKHARVTEPLLQRMFSELSRAVAWMHSVYLVHRDIKLENILLTCDPFAPQYAHPTLASPSLDLLPSPLLKLTDFGLSRFIDPASPLLATRCGSESYAAPEIVMGTKYDGRQTDAWACGVVLFSLATRGLPFDRHGVTGRLSGEGSGGGSDYGGSAHGSVSAKSAVDEHPEKGRRSYLIRIAKNEWSWPTTGPSTRLVTPELRKVVERLLVRDPRRRATLLDLWKEEWMHGPGGLPRPGEGLQVNIDEDAHSRRSFSLERRPATNDTQDQMLSNGFEPLELANVPEQLTGPDEEEEEEENFEGVFVNADQIDNVARLDINY